MWREHKAGEKGARQSLVFSYLCLTTWSLWMLTGSTFRLIELFPHGLETNDTIQSRPDLSFTSSLKGCA